MIIFLYGEDTFRSKQKLKEFKDKFVRDIDVSMLNVESIDGEKMNIDLFKQSMFAGGFLVKKRFIIVENFVEKNKNDQDAVLALLKDNESESEENIVIFWEGIGANSKDYKAKVLKGELFTYLKNSQYAFEFPVLDKIRLAVWIKKKMDDKGINIEHDAINLLIDLAGNDMWRINNEIDKLVAYNDKEITKEGVKTLVSEEFGDNVFALVDAIADQNKKLFSSLLSNYFSGENDSSYLLSMLIRQFRLLIYAKDRLAENTYANLALELKIPFFVERKIKNQISRYDLAKLKNIYEELLSIDIALKKNYFNPELLFLKLIG